MITYTAEVNLTKSDSKIKGFATLILNMGAGSIALDGFKIIEGQKGLFVAPPSVKGNKPKEDGTFPYFDTVMFRENKEEGEWFGEMQKAAYNAIMTAYNEKAKGVGATPPTNDRPVSRPRNPATSPAAW